MSRMTSFHKEILVDFIEKKSRMVSKGLEKAEMGEIRKLWNDLAVTMTQAGAVNRSGDEWKKAWGELLCRTKKLSRMYANSNGTKRKLTPLDHRILAAGRGNLETFENVEEPTSEQFIKSETIYPEEMQNENINIKTSENRLSESLPSESYGSDVNTEDSSEPLHYLCNGKRKKARDIISSLEITDLYPEWLVEIEKKRAKAELIRAQAAKQKAKAAIIHAEALKKLANAASLQADAIMKIAKVLENGHKTNLS